MAHFQFFSVPASLFILFSWILLLSVSNKSVVLGNPVPLIVKPQVALQPATVKLEDTKKPDLSSDKATTAKDPYPSLAECRKRFKVPATAKDDNYFYFSGLQTNTEIDSAKKYASDHGLVHVGMFYPEGWTRPKRYQGTPEELRQWQKDFSQVYAEATQGKKAYLMTKDYNEPAGDSIFKTVEFQAMKDKTKIEEIVWLDFKAPSDKPTEVKKTWWTKNGSGSPSGSPPSSTPPKSALDSCDVSYKVFFDSFEIRGKDFSSDKLGQNGLGLLADLRHCGVVTDWNFSLTPHDVKYQWYASGKLPIGTKSCVGSAAMRAGGSTDGNCHGAG
ncbi:hypothetical protein MMC10_000677 [Thelotrema lepadinum]|nr:hypothetical protein [Thelotrema lepadinum]